MATPQPLFRELRPGLMILAVASLFGLWAMGQLPEKVITHWGPDGKPDGWSSPLSGVMVLPLIALATAFALAIAPRIDPKRGNFAQHAKAYWLIANLVLALLAGIHVMVIGTNLGWSVDLPRVVVGAIGALLATIGWVLPQVEPNWIFGIRTPWTLSSERSWKETHRIGGHLLLGAGVLVILTAVALPSLMLPAVIVLPLFTALAAAIYSYLIWKRDLSAGSNSTGSSSK